MGTTQVAQYPSHYRLSIAAALRQQMSKAVINRHPLGSLVNLKLDVYLNLVDELIAANGLEVFLDKDSKQPVGAIGYSISPVWWAVDNQKALAEVFVIALDDSNTTKEVSMSANVAENTWDTQGVLFNVKSGQYGRVYRCFLDGAERASYTTPDGSQPSHTNMIDTNYIASQLITNLTSTTTTDGNGSTITNPTDYTVEDKGEGWFYVKRRDGKKITSAATRDGYNNQAFYSFIHATQKFANLPATAPDGFTVLVKGDTSSSSDDYYIKYDTAGGYWKECGKPGLNNSLDAATMPHQLVRLSDDNFSFGPTTWDDREVGDLDSNPEPSFVGKTINDIFFVRNRLGVLAGENTILSKPGEFFKYWMTTATDVLDTDYIDDAVPDESVAILKHAVVFNEELVLFSTHAQFVGTSDTIFTPKNYRLDKVTSFEALPHCRPVAAGRRIYFCNERSEYSSLMEFYLVASDSSIKDAMSVSNHVPSYIPNTVHKIIASTTENMLLLLTTGETNRIYVYKYLWQDEQRVQSAWSHWEFASGEIIGAGFMGAALYLVLFRNGSLFLEKMVFTYDSLDYSAEPYRVYLDRKQTYTIPLGLFHEDTATTTIPVTNLYPYGIPEGITYAVVTADGLYQTFDSSTGSLSFNGDLTGTVLIVGEVIDFKVTLSEIMVKEDDGHGGIKADTNGRLQVRKLQINYNNSGGFDVTVKHKGKKTYQYSMTSRILGDADNSVGAIPLDTGTFNVPIQGNSKDVTVTIESNTPAPIALIGFNWEGNKVERSAK